jgi:hypothetical protein
MGRFGLFLVRIVIWAIDRLSRTPRGPEDYLWTGAAHVALSTVSVIGTVIDRLPSISPVEIDQRVRCGG